MPGSLFPMVECFKKQPNIDLKLTTATIKVELGARPNSAKLFNRSSSVSSRLG